MAPTIADSERGRHTESRVAQVRGAKERRRHPRKNLARVLAEDVSAGPVKGNHAQQRDLDSDARRVKPRPTSGREHSHALDDQS